MSQVVVVPEAIAAAATDVAAVGTSLNAAHLIAAAPTVAVIPAAADDISAGIAQFFSQHAQNYQTLAGKAAAFNSQFAQHLNASMHSYANAETANVASLAGAASSTDQTGSLLSLAVQESTAIQTAINTAVNQILYLLNKIAQYPHALVFLLTGANFGGLATLIFLAELVIYFQYRIFVPFAWPFPLGNPIAVPLIP